MRETPKAQQAFNDYVSFGPERSLEKLLALYQSRQQSASETRPPTVRYKTLADWSRVFGWQARLVAIAEQERAAIVAKGIADRQNRIDAANDRWHRMRELIEARAGDPLVADVPGGRTGLLVASPMLVKVYEASEDGDELRPTKQSVVLYEYAVDTGLLKEMREHEKQVAQDLGQWVDKQEHSGEMLIREYVGVSVDKV